VLSVGNLHWGGTGKTPTVQALAQHLGEGGRRLAVLSRGYGRQSRGMVVVSRGDGPEVDAGTAGDEPYLLARSTSGAVVVVGADRHAAGLFALEHIDPAIELFLLDDGFSHLRLARDVDLLLFPRYDPWGGGRLLPTGRLREPLAAARHADAVLVTAATDPGDGAALADGLRPVGFAGPGFAAGLETELLCSVDGPVVLVSAVAAPERIRQSALRHGLEVAEHLAFADHHPYPAASLRTIEAALCRHRAAAVVTTSKDLGKLAGRLQAPVVELTARLSPEAGFWTWLDARLAATAP
jgi:tetraacyldisaccharide 4'-kinase